MKAPSRRKRRERDARVIIISVFLGLIAFIGIVFLVSGLEFLGGAVRTTATVVAVRQVTDFGMARAQHTEFTLRFADQGHGLVTEQTDQVREVSSAPVPGDRIQVYYPAGDPAGVTDARFGSPGAYNYEMGGVFCGVAAAGWIAIAIIVRVRAKRRLSRAAGVAEGRVPE